MSSRHTPISAMEPARLAAWAERRSARLKQERDRRYLSAAVGTFLIVLVALVLAGMYLEWSKL